MCFHFCGVCGGQFKASATLIPFTQEEGGGLDLNSPQEIEEMAKDLNSPTVESATNKDEVVVNQVDYPISTLVWGKLKGFDWWPGRISSHIEIGGSEPHPDGSLWVKWFGENQVSEVMNKLCTSLYVYHLGV